MLKESHLIVKGCVQGVGFRYFVKNLANHHNLVGYTKNLADMSVEICVQGPELAISSFLKDLKQPHNPIKIDEILLETSAPSKLFCEFQILT